MLHLIYVFAFTTLAIIAVGNLIRNLMILGSESSRHYAPKVNNHNPSADPSANYGNRSSHSTVPHPEFLDDTGTLIREPLLVMRSITVEDAREKLDALYNSSTESTVQDEPEER